MVDYIHLSLLSNLKACVYTLLSVALCINTVTQKDHRGLLFLGSYSLAILPRCQIRRHTISVAGNTSNCSFLPLRVANLVWLNLNLGLA